MTIKEPLFRGVWGALAGYRTWSRYYAHQHIHQLSSRPNENSDLESGNPNFEQFKDHNFGAPGDLTGYRTWLRYNAHQHIQQV